MSRTSFVFLCCIVFVSNQSFAKKWCSRNDLESLLQCLSHTGSKFIPHMEPFEILNQRIACSKIGDCTPKLFQVWNKKIRLVRKYGKCMKNNILGLQESSLLYDSSIEQNCRKYLNDNLPDSFKDYNLHLLPNVVDE